MNIDQDQSLVSGPVDAGVDGSQRFLNASLVKPDPQNPNNKGLAGEDVSKKFLNSGQSSPPISATNDVSILPSTPAAALVSTSPTRRVVKVPVPSVTGRTGLDQGKAGTRVPRDAVAAVTGLRTSVIQSATPKTQELVREASHSRTAAGLALTPPHTLS